MRLGLYRIGGKILIPLWYKTEAGFFVEREPIDVVDLEDQQHSLEALVQKVRMGNPSTINPPRNRNSRPVILSYAGVKTLSEFEAIAQPWSMFDDEANYFLVPWKKRVDKGWEEDLDKLEQYPKTSMTVRDFLEKSISRVREITGGWPT